MATRIEDCLSFRLLRLSKLRLSTLLKRETNAPSSWLNLPSSASPHLEGGSALTRLPTDSSHSGLGSWRSLRRRQNDLRAGSLTTSVITLARRASLSL